MFHFFLLLKIALYLTHVRCIGEVLAYNDCVPRRCGSACFAQMSFLLVNVSSTLFIDMINNYHGHPPSAITVFHCNPLRITGADRSLMIFCLLALCCGCIHILGTTVNRARRKRSFRRVVQICHIINVLHHILIINHFDGIYNVHHASTKINFFVVSTHLHPRSPVFLDLSLDLKLDKGREGVY